MTTIGLSVSKLVVRSMIVSNKVSAYSNSINVQGIPYVMGWRGKTNLMDRSVISFSTARDLSQLRSERVFKIGLREGERSLAFMHICLGSFSVLQSPLNMFGATGRCFRMLLLG